MPKITVNRAVGMIQDWVTTGAAKGMILAEKGATRANEAIGKIDGLTGGGATKGFAATKRALSETLLPAHGLSGLLSSGLTAGVAARRAGNSAGAAAGIRRAFTEADQKGIDRALNYAQAPFRYLGAADFAGQGARRAGVAAARIAATSTALGVGRSIISDNGVFTDSRGNLDIAGIPFI